MKKHGETMTETHRRIVMASRPKADPTPENFRLEEGPLPKAGAGEILLRTKWLSLDPYMRGRMSDAPSYAAPVEVGGVMQGEAVSEVISSDVAGFTKGDHVAGHIGWQSHAVSNGKGLRKIAPGTPLAPSLGVLGMPGMTAYTGLLEIGKPKEGETVVVAAASGAVGQLVGQIAKLKGARAVGIAGGAEKCRYVVEELGFDACIDHKAPGFAEKLKDACPKGIDVYFENVGGQVFEAVFPLLNFFARIPVCGLIAQYSMTELPPGPNKVPQIFRAVLTKRLNIRGFIVWDFAEREADFRLDMGEWVRSGKIKHREYVVDGLENAPKGFIGMLKGENFGKTVVRVAADAE
jgi:NADPH-dependent curcumin reductase CurA